MWGRNSRLFRLAEDSIHLTCSISKPRSSQRREEITKRGFRELTRVTGMSQQMIEAIRDGKPVRRTTLNRMEDAVRL